jgi:outer membrane immunogenic protein
MKILRLLSIVALSVAGPVTVKGAEPLVIALSTDSSVPVTNTAFDWDGFYAGVYGVVQTRPGADTQLGIGLNVGVNAQLEFVLVGAEVAVQGLGDGGEAGAYLQGLGA